MITAIDATHLSGGTLYEAVVVKWGQTMKKAINCSLIAHCLASVILVYICIGDMLGVMLRTRVPVSWDLWQERELLQNLFLM